MPKVYNKLENPALQFGILWRVGREYCEYVKGSKPFKNDDLTEVAGNRQFGFQSRRQKREVSSMVETIDKTGLKKKRGSVCRPRKMVCKLPTSFEVYWSSLEPEEQKRRQKEQDKRVRAGKRNRAARKGRRQTLVFESNPTKGKRGGLTPTVR